MFSQYDPIFDQVLTHTLLNDPFITPQQDFNYDFDPSSGIVNMAANAPHLTIDSSYLHSGHPDTLLEFSEPRGEFPTQALRTPESVSSVPSESVSGSSSSSSQSIPPSQKKNWKGKVRAKYLSDEDLVRLREKNRGYQSKSRKKVKASLEELERLIAERDETIARLREENSELKGRLWVLDGMGSGSA